MRSDREIVCIACPIGCRVQVELEGKTVVSIKGNTCKRGETYAVEECTAPKRILTSTVEVGTDGKRTMLPVKTNGPIPKELLFDAMEIIKGVRLLEMPGLGDVIVKNLLDTGVDVVCTAM